ncbi:MAG TPA: hypothetical protein VEL48_02335, partial [Candidatus Acidoferrales bacterium]|nr:hypothetical protein [Candidatus Acidoferrales bacterium]
TETRGIPALFPRRRALCAAIRSNAIWSRRAGIPCEELPDFGQIMWRQGHCSSLRWASSVGSAPRSRRLSLDRWAVAGIMLPFHKYQKTL